MSTANRTLVGLGLVVTIGAIALVQGREVRGSRAAGQAAPMAKAKGTTDASGVMYFSREEITPAFKANLMMYDGVPEKNYRVAVYHRDKGGEVEIHKKDTDVFYILEGEATFVTGGTVTVEKETAPDEIRIATMEGGVTRKIEKGDVVVIPANVTHWFKEVEKPVTYFGVKVR
jgi:quercetin dioxygenase-like cupin family protein